MLKYLCLTAALIPSTAQIAFSSVPPSVSTLPPVCYMQTPNGRTLNLSSICGKKSAQQAVCVEISDPERRAVFAEFYRNNNQALANLECNAPPPPQYLPEDGSTPG